MKAMIKLSLLLAVSFVLFTCGAEIKNVKKEKFSIEVEDFETLMIFNNRGNIAFTDNGTSDKIVIQYTKTASLEADNDKVMVKTNNNMDEKSIGIEIEEKPGIRGSVIVDFNIKVPSKGFGIEVDNGKGNVTIKKVEKVNSVKLRKGKVNISGVQFIKTVKVDSGDVKIEFTDLTNDTVDELGKAPETKIELNNGNVFLNVKKITFDKIEPTTDIGTIKVSKGLALTGTGKAKIFVSVKKGVIAISDGSGDLVVQGSDVTSDP